MDCKIEAVKEIEVVVTCSTGKQAGVVCRVLDTDGYQCVSNSSNVFVKVHSETCADAEKQVRAAIDKWLK